MTGIPAREVSSRRPQKETVFRAYGTASENSVDSRELVIKGLLDEVQSLRSRFNVLEDDIKSPDYEPDTGHVEAMVNPYIQNWTLFFMF